MDYSDFANNLRAHDDAGVPVASTSTSTSDPAPSTSQHQSAHPPPVPSTSHTHDVAMDVAHDDIDSDMPALQEVSDSEDEDDAHEVEMESAVDDPPLPEVEPVQQHQVPRPNRRARVEDDDDDDRDRRHPSHRINTPLTGPSRASSRPSSRPPPAQRPRSELPFPANLFAQTHLPQPQNDAPNANAPRPRQQLGDFLRGIAISFDLDDQPSNNTPGFNSIPGAFAPGFPFPIPGLQEGQTLHDYFSNPNFLHDILGMEPDVDDPERADRLIKGLEEVPLGLVKRLERVGGMTGANDNELSGGDSGCAVCWEKLLDEEYLKDSDKDESEHPKIVSLPCAHVFHAECLRPWFSRPKQTTCPTCRFNIDPENLTFVPYRQRRRTQEQARGATQTTPTASQSTTATPAPAAAPNPAAPPAATSTSATTSTATPAPAPSTEEPVRGRAAPSPTATGGSSRRPSSEPPINRRPAPAPTPMMSDILQSIPIPGGHLVIVNHPLGHIVDAQGRPTGGTGQQPQGAASSQNEQPNSPPVGTTASTPAPTPQVAPQAQPQPDNRPMFGPPPPPPGAVYRGMRRGGPGGDLPPGVMAFDFVVPIPASFPFGPQAPAPPPASGAQPAPATQPAPAPGTQPRPAGIRPPQMGFAGLHFGAPTPSPNLDQLLQTLFNNFTAATAPQPQPAPTAPTSAATTPAANPEPAQAQPAAANAANEQTRREEEAAGNFARGLAHALSNPNFLMNILASAGGPGGLFGAPGGARRDNHARRNANAPKKDWTPPPAPGPTLRQRIEKKEREAGLRCYDTSCGIGPSDEEPFIALSEAMARQFSIRTKEDGSVEDNGKGREKKLCDHTFHSSCLVSAERVALRGADAAVNGDGSVEVSCPVCRHVGCVSKGDWEEGVHFLE